MCKCIKGFKCNCHEENKLTKVEVGKTYVSNGGGVHKIICVDKPGLYPIVSVSDSSVFEWSPDLRLRGSYPQLVKEYTSPSKLWVSLWRYKDQKDLLPLTSLSRSNDARASMLNTGWTLVKEWELEY